MKERPILLGPKWVRALLDGRKTQTRRPITPRPPSWVEQFGVSCFTPDGCFSGRGRHPTEGPSEVFRKCPFGVVGDRLWVRETWCPIPEMKPSGYFTNPKWIDRVAFYAADNDRPTWAGERWKPSIHMPRWASRIDVKIVDVRAERLGSITHSDAFREGIDCSLGQSPKVEYLRGWDDIYGERGFGFISDPWVWVITWKVIGLNAGMEPARNGATSCGKS